MQCWGFLSPSAKETHVANLSMRCVLERSILQPYMFQGGFTSRYEYTPEKRVKIERYSPENGLSQLLDGKLPWGLCRRGYISFWLRDRIAEFKNTTLIAKFNARQVFRYNVNLVICWLHADHQTSHNPNSRSLPQHTWYIYLRQVRKT